MLALLDYHLPDMTGDQLLAACTRTDRPVVAIIMTTDPTPELALQVMRQGAHSYVRKPFDPAYLMDLCARALRERALLRVEELLEARTRELRASEAQFRLLFDSIPDAVLVHETDGTILAINDVGARWMGCDAAELVGQPIRMLWPQGPPPMTWPPIVPTSEHRTTFQTVCIARTGRRIAVEVTECTITFQGKTALLSVVRDISERERAIVALQNAKEYAENIINSSLDIIVSVDTQRRIIAFNKAAQEAFGYEPADVLGQPVHILYADPTVGGGIHHQALTDGRYIGEITNKRKDGTVFDAYLSASVLHNSHGQEIGVMGISRDITMRKQAEAALQASKDAAEAANRSKSEFLANVSHEIRTPMNGILGMTELALGTDLSAEQRECLDLVKVSAEALLGVINDLLDFSKIEAGRLVLDPCPFALRASVHEAVKALAVPAYRKGLELVYDVAPDVPEALIGDVGRLRQIIVNLVGNAIKFTPTGEVVLRIRPAVEPDQASMLHIAVTDTGIGIPLAQQQAIFQPFVQADGAMTRRYGGTGLGLSIAAQLVTLMGGRIWVESTVGVGSTFHCTVHVGVQNVQPPGVTVPAMCHGLAVLVVDDNAAQRGLLDDLLQRWGMTPTLVANATAACETLWQASQASQPFAIVVLDAQLPDDESATVASWMRQHSAYRCTPLLVLTAATQTGDRQRWQEWQIAACATKPLAPAEFAAALERAFTPAADIAPMVPPREGLSMPAGRALRILLAEDHVVNQRLAVRLLEKRGHTVTVVPDGVEALAALQHQTFDLLLMDIQMPRMDGLEATQIIRAREQGTPVHLPMVAMTAHAMQGDRERCLAAGMDGYVTKPLRPTELFEVIESLTAPVPLPLAAPMALPIAPEVFDRATLWARVDGDADLLCEIVDLFLADCPDRLAELRDALTRQDTSGLARAAHRFKGALGNISANTALTAVRQLETLAHAGDLQGVTTALARLEEELVRLIPLLAVCAEDAQAERGRCAQNVAFG